MKREDFPIDKGLVDEFIKLNTGKWSDSTVSDKYVYINMSMVRMQMAWVIPKLLYAKGVADRKNAGCIALTWGENEVLSELFASMGINHVSLESMNRKDIKAFFLAGFKTLGILLKCKTGEDFKKVRLFGIPVGLSLYEDILRTSTMSTIRSLRNKTCIKKIFHLLWMMYALKDYIKKNPACFNIADDLAYHEWMQTALFKISGAKSHNVSVVGMEEILLDDKLHTVRRGTIRHEVYEKLIGSVTDEQIAIADETLAKRFAGLNGRDIDRQAFAGKKVLSKEDFVNKFGIDPSKKTAVIMAHTFTDAVFNYGVSFYKDYYDWLERTLKIAREITDVNFILKPHPTRAAYHEDADSIEMMYERLKADHIFLLPDDVSAESIKNIADAVITIGGNAGAEFACLGVPAIITGNPYYKGFGFTLEPRTEKDYIACLKKLPKIKRLNDEQIKNAKKVFYLNTNYMDDTRFSDEFAKLLQGEYKKMQDEMNVKYFESNKGTKDYNDIILKCIIEYEKTHNLTDCEFYRKGYSIS